MWLSRRKEEEHAPGLITVVSAFFSPPWDHLVRLLCALVERAEGRKKNGSGVYLFEIFQIFLVQPNVGLKLKGTFNPLYLMVLEICLVRMSEQYKTASFFDLKKNTK